MKKVLSLLVAFVSVSSIAGADDEIRLVQEALRDRQLYFGQIDGRKNADTLRALERYEREATPPSGATNSGEPVLRSEAVRQMQADDRKFLESLDPAELPPIAERIPAPGAQPDSTRPQSPDATRHLSEQSIEMFVREYLTVCERNQPAAELAFYGDKVKYFNQGVVDRRFIQKDIAAFYRRWPERKYQLLNLKVVRNEADRTVVKFGLAYQYRSPKRTASGRTENTFTIGLDGDRPVLSAMQERRVRD